jgi:hypothetical protein
MLIENINYEIEWREFKRGTSFFIPCLDPKSARKIIVAETERLKYDTVTKILIEEGIKGLRTWRI